MDKEKRKILNTMLKFFEEKGYKKEEIEEIEELAEEKEKKKKGKLHPFEKITDLKDMLEKTEKNLETDLLLNIKQVNQEFLM